MASMMWLQYFKDRVQGYQAEEASKDIKAVLERVRPQQDAIRADLEASLAIPQAAGLSSRQGCQQIGQNCKLASTHSKCQKQGFDSKLGGNQKQPKMGTWNDDEPAAYLGFGQHDTPVTLPTEPLRLRA